MRNRERRRKRKRDNIFLVLLELFRIQSINRERSKNETRTHLLFFSDLLHCCEKICPFSADYSSFTSSLSIWCSRYLYFARSLSLFINSTSFLRCLTKTYLDCNSFSFTMSSQHCSLVLSKLVWRHQQRKKWSIF